jgi:L,D-transpeptidase ErfK/SrfK
METEDKSWFKKFGPWAIPFLLFFLIAANILYTPQFQNAAYLVKSLFTSISLTSESNVRGIDKQIQASKSNISLLRNKLSDLIPEKPYIIINTTDNRFELRNSKDTIRTGVCSTGKDVLLIGPKGKKWLFKTPKGMFSVLLKRKDAPWIKPDWAYIEEGMKPPSARSDDRIEYGSLGKYQISIGDNYMLHGTLYKRFLGLPVTHGCVRLGDEDLEVIFNSLDKGSKVFIF